MRKRAPISVNVFVNHSAVHPQPVTDRRALRSLGGYRVTWVDKVKTPPWHQNEISVRAEKQERVRHLWFPYDEVVLGQLLLAKQKGWVFKKSSTYKLLDVHLIHVQDKFHFHLALVDGFGFQRG